MPCTQCEKRGIDCTYPASQCKRGPKPKKIASVPLEPPDEARSTISLLTLNSQLGNEYSIMQQLNSTREQLEVERRLTEHWRAQFFNSQQTTEPPQSSHKALAFPGASGSSRTVPLFSAETQYFIANTSAAITSVVSAFKTGYLILHRQYPFTFDPQKGAQFWAQFMLTTPDSYRIAMRTNVQETVLVDALEYSVMFSHGAHGTTHHDLAEHFGLIALEIVHLLVYDRDTTTRPHFASRLGCSFSALADFCKYTMRRSAQLSLMGLCESLLARFSTEVNNSDLIIQIYSHNALNSPDEKLRQHWLTKTFDAISQNTTLDRRFFFTFRAITVGLYSGNDSPSQLHEWLRTSKVVDEQVASYSKSLPADQAPDVSAFYTTWIIGIRCEIMRRLGRADDAVDLVIKGTNLFHGIKNKSLKAILVSLGKRCSAIGTKPLLMIRSFLGKIGLADISARTAPAHQPSPLSRIPIAGTTSPQSTSLSQPYPSSSCLTMSPSRFYYITGCNDEDDGAGFVTDSQTQGQQQQPCSSDVVIDLSGSILRFASDQLSNSSIECIHSRSSSPLLNSSLEAGIGNNLNNTNDEFAYPNMMAFPTVGAALGLSGMDLVDDLLG